MEEKMLEIAYEEAKRGELAKDGGPFGVVLTDKDYHIISRGHNEVLKTNDPTNHAEIVAIRKACQALNTHDLKDYILFSTCEPCPMCLSAIIWSNIKTVYFGATRENAAHAGFRDSFIYDYLNGKNDCLKRIKIDNIDCQEQLENYKGEIY